MAERKDIDAVKRNISRLIAAKVPQDAIEKYIATEGYSLEEVRNYQGSKNIASQGAAGLAEGIASGTIGLPGTAVQAGEWVGRNIFGRPIGYGLEAIGIKPKGSTEAIYKAQDEAMNQMYPGYAQGTVSAGGIPTAAGVIKGMSPYMPAETKDPWASRARIAGRVIGGAAVPIGGEVASAAAAGKAILPAAGRAIAAYGVAPAVTGETAYSLAKNVVPSVADYARLGGELLGGGIGAVSMMPSKMERLVTEAASGATPQQIAQAQNLVNTAKGLGIDLTIAEALDSVTKGQTNLTAAQRVLEQVPAGRQVLGPVMAGRPGQVKTAVSNLKEQISPTIGEADVGIAAGKAAKSALDEANATINKATRPYYDAARASTLPQANFNRLSKSPQFSNLLKQLRSDKDYGPLVEGLPDNSIEVLDRLKKFAFDRAAEVADQPHRASLYSSIERDILDEIKKAALPRNANLYAPGAVISQNQAGLQAYLKALDMQKAMREQLAPFKAGPIGDIAANASQKSGAEATQRVAEALLPTRPYEGMEKGVELAGGLLGGKQGATQTLARQIARATVDTKTQRFMSDLMSGENPFGGAAFANAIAGSEQKAKNFAALIKGVTNGRTADEAMTLMNVLKATGARQRPGSMTSFNNEFLKALESADGLDAAVQVLSNPTSIPRKASDFWARFNIRANSRELANMLLDPRAGDALLQLGPEASNKIGRALQNYFINATQAVNRSGLLDEERR